MSVVKNPVEKRVDLLRDLWMRHTQDERTRVVVWRIEEQAERLLQVFFAMQEHPGDWEVPDLFLSFALPFDTSFGYSRGLRLGLINGYADHVNEDENDEDAALWRFTDVPPHDSAAGFVELLGSFAEHVRGQVRSVAAVLAPPPATDAACAAFEGWLEAALRTPIPASARIVLVDTAGDPRWTALAGRSPRIVECIDTPVDMLQVMRETMAQSGGQGAENRLLMTDLMALLVQGTAAQATARADLALALARKAQAHDQQAMLHMIVAGAHLKEKSFVPSIERYRQARESALQAEEAKHPVGTTLAMQTWLGEGGAWMAAGKLDAAAKAYEQAARLAQKIPDPLFAIEGFRMAGYCLAQNGQPKAAYAAYLSAVQQAMPFTPQERAMTTLPVALQDMLRLDDKKRAQEIELSAQSYRKSIAEVRQIAEAHAQRLGSHPLQTELLAIENEMELGMVNCFRQSCLQRQKLIVKGSNVFRQIVATGRQLLHPGWNGFPEIENPVKQDFES